MFNQKVQLLSAYSSRKKSRYEPLTLIVAMPEDCESVTLTACGGEELDNSLSAGLLQFNTVANQGETVIERSSRQNI
jgi:hypothetical protein